MSAPPLVHVVVVDHDGGDLTRECLRHVVASDWPADRLRVVLVENGSRKPVVAAVRREFPTVEVVESPVNRGFAGGANLGMRRRGDADYVALVNNDAFVTPGWLDPLVATCAADPTVGAACPKILLAAPAVEVGVEAPTHRRGRGDRRDLGVRVGGARVGTTEVGRRLQRVSGFWGTEPMPPDEAGAQWTAARAVLRIPVDPDAPDDPVGDLALRLAADAPTPVTLRSGTRTTTVTVGRTPAWYPVPSDAAPVEVCNNVGSVIAPDGHGADRGWLEVDLGQYDAPADVDAWCGAAVLLRREYLDDVGLFDERLFLYYEDVDLSLRGARRGWRYRTAPTSVVRHVHSATSGEGSPLAAYYNERNRLLVQGDRVGPVEWWRSVARHLAITVSYARRDVVAPLAHGHRPQPAVVTGRLRALGGAVLRRRDRRRTPPGPEPAPGR